MSARPQKLKPYADAIRARVRALQPLAGTVFTFAPGEWRPFRTFWVHVAESVGMELVIRNKNERTFVFRMV